MGTTPVTKLRIPRAGVLIMTATTDAELAAAGRNEPEFAANEACGFAAKRWFRADTPPDEVIEIHAAARRMGISVTDLSKSIGLGIIPVGQNKANEEVIPYACFRWWKDNLRTAIGVAFLAEISATDEKPAATPREQPSIPPVGPDTK